jgi:regulator of replication initiation timing
MNELNELEKANIQVIEVRELKKKMQQLYFRGFHINIL